jgi:hypothetical protein
MHDYLKKVRKPVRRFGAENNLLIILISFAATVILTRTYLSLANYPQLGEGPLHIAHVLWGGLFLFAGCLIPILFTNRWTFSISSLFAGIGVGLFIDEIGKFITLSNNYFYQPAAAIIYALFLLTVLLYWRIQRPRSHDARTELYHALDLLEELLENDLDREEYEEIVERLEKISKEKSYPELSQLSSSILEFLNSENIRIEESELSSIDKIELKLQNFEKRILKRRVYKSLLTLALFILSLLSTENILMLIKIAFSHEYFQQLLIKLLEAQVISGNTKLALFLTRLFLESAVGVCFFIATYFWITQKEKKAISLSVFTLLASLTTIQLLAFYFDQFRAVIGSVIQLIILLGILRYRTLYQNPMLKSLRHKK